MCVEHQPVARFEPRPQRGRDKDAQSHAADDRRKKDEVEAKNQADNLVFQTRKHMKEFGEKMPAELKKRVETAADDLDAAVKAGITPDIRSKMEALNAVWTEASSAMYQNATAGAGAPGGGPGPEAAPGPQQQPGKKDGKAVEDASFEVMDDKEKEK